MYTVRTILSDHNYDVDLLGRLYPSLSEVVGNLVSTIISVESYKETQRLARMGMSPVSIAEVTPQPLPTIQRAQSAAPQQKDRPRSMSVSERMQLPTARS